MSAAAAALAPVLPTAAPAWMAHLVDRAAMLLLTRRPKGGVDFTWRADGETWHYSGRVEWEWDWPRPRLVVRDKNGEFVCQSLPGDFWTIDPAVWHIDAAEDDVNHAQWLEANQQRGGAR